MKMPVTARCPSWAPPRGHTARAAIAHARKQAADRMYRTARKQGAERRYRMARNFIGGACGMPYRATMKPVLQMITNTAGMARTSRSWRSSLRMRLGDTLADFGQGLAQVIHHRPHGQDRGRPDQELPPQAGVDDAEQQAVVQQEGDRD